MHASFTGGASQTFREEITILHTLHQETEEKGMSPNAFYETSMALIPELTKTKPKKKKKILTDIHHEHERKTIN